jgi:hypothetical protein
VVELDDILVQALTRRARLRMQHLMRAAEDRYAAQRRLPAAQRTYASAIEVATAMLTEEFKGAFQQSSRNAQRQLFP